MNKKILLFCLFIGVFLQGWSSDIALLKSPDGRVVFRLFTENKGLAFSVRFNNVPVINNSPLVLSLDQVIVTENVKTGAAKTYTISESYPLLGIHAVAHNQCNGAKIPVIKDRLTYTIDVRVFNDGVAFRLLLPGSANESRVPDEATVFNLPHHGTIWYHDMEMHYESVHTKKEIGQVQKGEWVAPPATFKLPQGAYACITEADLKGYSGMSLQASAAAGSLLMTVAGKVLFGRTRPPFPADAVHRPTNTRRRFPADTR